MICPWSTQISRKLFKMNSISPDRRNKFKNRENNTNRKERLRTSVKENQHKLRNQLLDRFRSGLNINSPQKQHLQSSRLQGNNNFTNSSEIQNFLDPEVEKELLINEWNQDDIDALKEEMKYILEEEAAFQAQIKTYQNEQDFEKSDLDFEESLMEEVARLEK